MSPLSKGDKDIPFAQQRIFVTFDPEQEQSTALFVAQGMALPTQINLNFSHKYKAVLAQNLPI